MRLCRDIAIMDAEQPQASPEASPSPTPSGHGVGPEAAGSPSAQQPQASASSTSQGQPAEEEETGPASSSDADAAGSDGDEASKEVAECRRRGRVAMEQGRIEAAIDALSSGVKLLASGSAAARISASLKAAVYRERANAFCSMSKSYRSRPAERSEYSALYGLDPTHLAQLALADATKAAELQPGKVDAYEFKGRALFLLERYEEAAEAYLQGLGIDPSSTTLQAGLKEVQAELGDNKVMLKRQRTVDSVVEDLFECTLCMKLLFEPVTTPCGHTFCRACFMRAMDHSSKCPVCRTVLHCGRQLPITITLATIVSHTFPKEYEERRQEEREAGSAAGTSQSAPDAPAHTFQLPLFVMSLVLPGEKMSLNIFEPRYRLMIRRAMEGNRRFGMAQVGSNRNIDNVMTEAEIIECQPLPDGRYHLEIVGRRRVRMVSSAELDGYRVATVQPLSDDKEPSQGEEGAPDTPLSSVAMELAHSSDALLSQLRTLAAANAAAASRVRQLLIHIGVRPTDVELQGPNAQEAAENLGYWTAMLLLMVSPTVHDHHRSELLHMTSTRERLLWLNEHFAGAMPVGGRCSIM